MNKKINYLFVYLLFLMACKDTPDEMVDFTEPETVIEDTLTTEVDTNTVEIDTIYNDYDDYGPFHIGSNWQYKHAQYYIISDTIYEIDSTIYYYSITVESDTIISGIEYLKLSRTNYPNGFEEQYSGVHYYYQHSKAGEHFTAGTIEGEWYKRKFLDVNEEVGYEWVTDTSIHYPENIGTVEVYTKNKISEKGTTLEIDGQFYPDVIKVAIDQDEIFNGELLDTPPYYFSYYAKGIGLICNEYYNPFETRKTKLLSYEIAEGD